MVYLSIVYVSANPKNITNLKHLAMKLLFCLSCLPAFPAQFSPAFLLKALRQLMLPCFLLGALLISLFVTPLVYALDLTLPDDEVAPKTTTPRLGELGDPASSAMSFRSEQQLGKRLYRQLRRSGRVMDDPELNSWLRALGNRLLAGAAGSRGTFYFVLVDDASVNAFAMPGGVIAIHSGLILQTDSESELAAVMSHEIAHVTQRHLARRLQDSKNKAWLAGLGALAGAVAASQDPQLGQAVVTSSIAAQAQSRLNYSRQAETEADREGLRILRAARFSPQGMANFMEKLDRGQGGGRYQNISKYLRTHPLSIERLSDIRSQLGRQAGQVKAHSPSYRYAKAKLQAITKTPLRNKTLRDQGQDAARYQRYYQAWLAAQRNRFVDVFQHLGQQSPYRQEALLIAQALIATQKPQAALNVLQPLAKNYPNEEAIVIPLVDAYLALDKAAQAWQQIANVQSGEQGSLTLLERRQVVAQRTGRTAAALQAVAERYIRLGEYQHARGVLQQASQHPNVSAQDLARLQGLLREVAIDVRENKR